MSENTNTLKMRSQQKRDYEVNWIKAGKNNFIPLASAFNSPADAVNGRPTNESKGKTLDEAGEKTKDFIFVSTLESDTPPIYDFKAIW